MPDTGRRGVADNPVDEAIVSRRSVRAFLPDPVPLETVKHILDVSSRAPSGTNIQPWHVYVVAGEAKRKVSDAVIAMREEHGENPEYTYYPRKWREPYLARRRKVGWDLYGLLGIGRDDKAGMWRQMGRNYQFFDAPVGLFFFIDRDLELGSWLDIGMYLQNVMVAARGRNSIRRNRTGPRSRAGPSVRHGAGAGPGFALTQCVQHPMPKSTKEEFHHQGTKAPRQPQFP